MIAVKPLRIRLDKIDGLIRVYDGTGYLVLFGSEKTDSINNRIRYLIGVKSGITYVLFLIITQNQSRFIQPFNFHNVIILINSIFNKDKNNYYYNIFLEKASHDLPKKKFL